MFKLDLLAEAVGVGWKGDRKDRAVAIAFCDSIRELIMQQGISKGDVYYGGSIRREKPTVGDVDIVIASTLVNKTFYQKLNDKLHARGSEVTVRSMGESHASMLVDGFLLELKKCDPENLGAMLLFVTGSGDFNLGMRAFAKREGFALSQYGLMRVATGEKVAHRTEEDVFKALGVPYVAPRDRNVFSSRGSVEVNIPDAIMQKLPMDLFTKVKQYKIPDKDANGAQIPRDFLFNKEARHQYYQRRGVFKIPDELKLDRYV